MSSISVMSPNYQVLMLGADDNRKPRLQSNVEKALVRRGLPKNTITFLSKDEASSRNRKVTTMAVFFGSQATAVDTDLVTELIEESIIIAPVVSDTSQVNTEVPPQLRHVNAAVLGTSNEGIYRLTNLVLETFRLLRRVGL